MIKRYGCNYCDKKYHFKLLMIFHVIIRHKQIPSLKEILKYFLEILIGFAKLVFMIFVFITKVSLFPFYLIKKKR